MIEVVAVLVLTALLAGGVAVSLRRALYSVQLRDVIGRLVAFDVELRAAGVATGEPQALRYSLDENRVARVRDRDRGSRATVETYALPQRFDLRKVWLSGHGERPVISGTETIGSSADGQTPSYAVSVADGTTGQTATLVFSGLSGQITRLDDEQKISEIFRLLAR